jgi:hypothetical protein
MHWQKHFSYTFPTLPVAHLALQSDSNPDREWLLNIIFSCTEWRRLKIWFISLSSSIPKMSIYCTQYNISDKTSSAGTYPIITYNTCNCVEAVGWCAWWVHHSFSQERYNAGLNQTLSYTNLTLNKCVENVQRKNSVHNPFNWYVSWHLRLYKDF